MPIVYATVYRGGTNLAEYHRYPTVQRNFEPVPKELMEQAPYRYTDEGRFSYSNDEHTFDFFIDRGLTFLCVTNRDGVFVNTFKILKEMSTEFQTNYFDQEGSLNTSYGEQLKAIIENTAQVPT